MLDKKTFSLISLGCRVNRAEVDAWAAYLISCDWELCNIENSKLIIINTCTVTSIADKKTRQSVRSACRQNKNLNTKIFVTGCASAIDKELYKKMDSRIVIVDKKDMQDALYKICNNIKVEESQIAKVLAGDKFRTRVSIKIEDGCDNACTYCIVHKARGKAWSMPHKQVENEFSVLLDAGIKEIVLSGVDIGAYRDKDIGLEKLCDNLLKIIEMKNIDARFRISSIEPQNVSDELIEIMAGSNGRLCRHLHLPLQSGSTKVLSEMARKYNAQYYLSLVNKLKSKIPSIALSTDIIVGFPGETDSDFKESMDLAKKCGFMKIHVFPYSRRECTPAASRIDQIDNDVKTIRAKKLRDLSDKLAAKDLASRQGQEEYVLVESKDKARTESYHLVESPVGASVGALVKMKL